MLKILILLIALVGPAPPIAYVEYEVYEPGYYVIPADLETGRYRVYAFEGVCEVEFYDSDFNAVKGVVFSDGVYDITLQEQDGAVRTTCVMQRIRLPIWRY